MSGPTSSGQSEDTTQRASSTDSSAMAVDPAASLRALALSTLKKRKVAAPKAADPLPKHPLRPITHDNSIQLNYGPEEPELGASSTASPGGGPPRARLSPPPQTVPMDVDDEQAREEGEISDSESTPVTKVTSTPPKTVPAKPQPTVLNLPMKPTTSPLAAPSLLPDTDTDAPTASSSLSPSVSLVSPIASSRQVALSIRETKVFDGSQIRPGLTS